MERVAARLHAWATAQAVGGLIDARGATWAVVGGIAANVYRNDIRATGDVDNSTGEPCRRARMAPAAFIARSGRPAPLADQGKC